MSEKVQQSEQGENNIQHLRYITRIFDKKLKKYITYNDYKEIHPINKMATMFQLHLEQKDRFCFPEFFTTFNDKNNDMIFEGDILEVEVGRVSLGSSWYQRVSKNDKIVFAHCAVVFKSGAFQLEWDNTFNNKLKSPIGSEKNNRELIKNSISSKNKIKIIGNINQNSDLLKGE